MKMWQLCLLIGVLPSASLTTGCHNSSPPTPELSKQTFGYPGMQKPPAYYEEMKKMRAAQAKQQVPPAQQMPAAK